MRISMAVVSLTILSSGKKHFDEKIKIMIRTQNIHLPFVLVRIHKPFNA